MPIFAEVLVILATALATALVWYWVFLRPKTDVAQDLAPSDDPLCLLFDGNVLHHGTQGALDALSLWPGMHVWDDLRTALLPRFPTLPETAGRGGSGDLTLMPEDPDDPWLLKLRWQDGLCWVDMVDAAPLLPPEESPVGDHTAQERCCETMENPVWQADGTNAIQWANGSYRALHDALDLSRHSPVFDLTSLDDQKRVKLDRGDGPPRWFQISSHPFSDGAIHHAQDVTELVRSEVSQRSFMQTMAKTFAHLPIGLAIFGANGRLRIFNPALVDLTGLEPRYLATEPDMRSFFDRLRDTRRMPEPKNYGSWRQQISDMIEAASGAFYQETWTLEDGRTYAVQGRPHPDGATAFLIEDVSSQVSLWRNLRIELEQYEALLDQVDDAMAVFSNTGVLTFCNDAYRSLWGQTPENTFADILIGDAISLWRQCTERGPNWNDVADFVTMLGPREDISVPISVLNGPNLMAYLAPLSSDATMIRFRPVTLPVTASLTVTDPI